MIFPQVHLQGFPICSYMFLCFFQELPFSMGIWFKRSYYVLKDHRQSSFSIWQCPQGSFSSWTVLTQSSSYFKKDPLDFPEPPPVLFNSARQRRWIGVRCKLISVALLPGILWSGPRCRGQIFSGISHEIAMISQMIVGILLMKSCEIIYINQLIITYILLVYCC